MTNQKSMGEVVVPQCSITHSSPKIPSVSILFSRQLQVLADSLATAAIIAKHQAQTASDPENVAFHTGRLVGFEKALEALFQSINKQIARSHKGGKV